MAPVAGATPISKGGLATIDEDLIAQTLPDSTLPLVTAGELRVQDRRGKRQLHRTSGSS